ncbi:hypothetical protein KSP39_PZI006039 [Platanthera zijinensis]|uniref:Uncharacterized protein n=1 Tax=Platanthera zijinensis TaxID=2320716 RepID=A0AAP0GAX6_9ASPA
MHEPSPTYVDGDGAATPRHVDLERPPPDDVGDPVHVKDPRHVAEEDPLPDDYGDPIYVGADSSLMFLRRLEMKICHILRHGRVNISANVVSNLRRVILNIISDFNDVFIWPMFSQKF